MKAGLDFWWLYVYWLRLLPSWLLIAFVPFSLPSPLHQARCFSG